MRALAETTGFRSKLERWGAPVRVRLLSRELLSGASWGALAASIGIAGGWWLRLPASLQLAPLTALPLALGFAGLRHRGRRWTSEELALYLDARLETGEALTAALAMESSAPTGMASMALGRAAALTRHCEVRSVRPRLLLRHHWAGVVGIGLAALFLALPARQTPEGEALAPHRSKSVLLPSLKAVEALSRAHGRDAAQTARLRRIANEAQRLRDASALGLERSEALSRVASLRDRVRAERLTFGDAASRPGREAAVDSMAQFPGLSRATRALGDGDLSAFDEEMQRLAGELEASDRRKAQEILEEAARRAQNRGSAELAELLRKAAARLEKDGASFATLQELAGLLGDRLSPEQRAKLGSQSQATSAKAQAQLAESLARALAELDSAQRQALAERLGESIAHLPPGDSSLTKQALGDLAKQLATPEGQAQLAEALQRLAESPPLDAAAREAELERAERGLGDAQRELSAIPVPLNTEDTSRGPATRSAAGARARGSASTPVSPGSSPEEGEGPGQHESGDATARASEAALRAKADARLLPGLPMRGSSVGRAPARVGERAELPTEAAIRAGGPDAIRGVERPEIPEEYRDHVGRYFNP